MPSDSLPDQDFHNGVVPHFVHCMVSPPAPIPVGLRLPVPDASAPPSVGAASTVPCAIASIAPRSVYWWCSASCGGNHNRRPLTRERICS
jgi:hypothetical protein